LIRITAQTQIEVLVLYLFLNFGQIRTNLMFIFKSTHLWIKLCFYIK